MTSNFLGTLLNGITNIYPIKIKELNEVLLPLHPMIYSCDQLADQSHI